MKKDDAPIILACFDFFRDEDFCLSREIHEELQKRPVAGFVSLLLPVDWEKIESSLDEIMAMESRAVLFLGNGRGESYRVEKIGINACGTSIKDNFDRNCTGDEIEEGKEAGRFATWNAKSLCESLKAENLPARISYYSGVFLCNYALFHSLGRIARSGEKKPVTLLHLSPERNVVNDLPAVLRAVSSSLKV